jgi:GntR family transcriptional regulator / MocR family aminotransferase
MPKIEQFSDLFLKPRSADTTLYRWLFEELRSAIAEGRLRPTSRLPSSRSLSRQYNVSRGIVVCAFEQLCAEGYVDCQVGSGSFVRTVIPERRLEARKTQGPLREIPSNAGLSARGHCMANNSFPGVWTNQVSPAFRVGQPSISTFPMELWSRIASRRLRRAPSSMLAYGEPLGYRPLRDAIADHVGKARGVKCTADEVVITSGTQRSLDLIARLLLDRGDKVWMEEPGFPGATRLFQAHGAQVVPVPVDEEGMNCKAGRALNKSAKLAYVTPAHQFPMGVTMSFARRTELLQWAREENAWIFEDEYDGEFRYTGRPLAALRSMDGGDCVIYSSTFNKLLFPTLQLGFMVVPPRLAGPIAAAKSITDRFTSVLDQAILCDFISEGHLGTHIRRMREIYAGRLDILVNCVRTELEGFMDLSPARAGLQVVGMLSQGISAMEVHDLAFAQGIESVTLSCLAINKSLPEALVLGFAAADSRAIRGGITCLAEIIRGVKIRNLEQARIAH